MPSQKKRPVTLTSRDSEQLIRVTTTGVSPASAIMRARVLLALDTSVGEVDPKEVIAARVGVSGETPRLVSKRFAETGGDIWTTIKPKQRELVAGFELLGRVRRFGVHLLWQGTVSAFRGRDFDCQVQHAVERTARRESTIRHTTSASWRSCPIF
ncbi:hypothetical protein [Amycolatopsis sp. H20-H5]|uniref:hypothetical protein n=1 Tax=Amycolatopsis sp. H20-H5 TaxID=3046309 RepID=UPI002DBB2214|nr:hypothetical protein [Amycolatopsis sp. H20-H5]MEC3976974.1 hypothetical protein [Amycolatopsis sp. H20-H5]